MQARRYRLREFALFAATPGALWPTPAFAAAPAFSVWGAYLFFAIVATVLIVLIVLLLHEGLADEPVDDPRGDDAFSESLQPTRSARARYISRDDHASRSHGRRSA